MRPTLNVLSDEQTTNILNEAKRIMAEVGMNIRGAEMKKRLLDHGLKIRPLTMPDAFFEQDKPEEQARMAGLDADGIVATVLAALDPAEYVIRA